MSGRRDPPELVVARAESTDSGSERASQRGRVAGHLVERATRRLELVCIATLGALFVLWFLLNLVRGELAGELAAPHQWVPPVTASVASSATLVAVRSRRFGPSTLVRLGLVYEVAVSFSIACASYLGAFRGLAPSDLNIDRVGMTYVAPWTLFFTVLVPAAPREALVALLVSASAPSLVYVAEMRSGAAPVLPASQLVLLFVVPYVANTALAYFAARIVHQLGVEVRRARELGSYHLDALLGRGGMGEVWRASHRTLARPAAVKLIRPSALADDAQAAAVAAARFEREAQVIASLQSPHTIELYDFGTTDDGTLFYVMELLDGLDLEDLVRRFGPLPAERAVHLLRQVCASLAEAHRRGVVHRDIKPANIYLCRRGIEHDVIKVLDFGLAKRVTAPEPKGAPALSHAGAVAGTPYYMAPEVALGRPDVDGRSDLYALGCVAFWLLTGRVVFEAGNVTAALVAHVQTAPVAPSSVSELPVPEALDQLVLECLAKDPAERPRAPEDVAERLAAIALPRIWSEGDAAHWWREHRPAEPRNASA